MNKLRDTLSDSVDSPRYIETLPRRGYRLIAAVEPIAADDAGAAPLVSKGAGLGSANSETRPAASTRSGNFQVWKVSAEGGSAVQVTQHGGHAAAASLDGKLIYYAKSQYANPEIWQVPVNGGTEKLVSPLLNPVTWAAWSVTRRGIVFAHPSGQGRPVVSIYDPALARLTTFTSLPIAPFWFTASPDARSILFDQPGWQQAQIMLVDNFR